MLNICHDAMTRVDCPKGSKFVELKTEWLTSRDLPMKIMTNPSRNKDLQCKTVSEILNERNKSPRIVLVFCWPAQKCLRRIARSRRWNVEEKVSKKIQKPNEMRTQKCQKAAEATAEETEFFANFLSMRNCHRKKDFWFEIGFFSASLLLHMAYLKLWASVLAI